ncbi:MAG: hypothetical protein ACE14P_05530 [Methanotrichaceae archaeon]
MVKDVHALTGVARLHLSFMSLRSRICAGAAQAEARASADSASLWCSNSRETDTVRNSSAVLHQAKALNRGFGREDRPTLR